MPYNMNISTYSRQVVLDTETTGINNDIGSNPCIGHRVIEIGLVEIVNRKITGKYFHTYLNPQMNVNHEAFNVHGISNQFLKDKPIFLDIVQDFIQFIKNSDLIIHNAFFDVSFINQEFKLINYKIQDINIICKIIDSLKIAKKLFFNKRNSLDALCDRYLIDRSKRSLHGALLDAKILAEIFLLMTGGQINIDFNVSNEMSNFDIEYSTILENNFGKNNQKLKVIYASEKELKHHRDILQKIQEKSKKCLWYKFENNDN